MKNLNNSKKFFTKSISLFVLVSIFLLNFLVLQWEKSQGVSVYADENIVVLELKDYDVDPSGMNDSGQGIYQALQKAKELSISGKHIVLQFEKKATYTIQKEFSQIREVHTSNTSSVDYPQKHIALLIEGINNLTIEGNNSELLIEGDMMVLGIFQSENIRINNLSWDYRVPTTSELTIFDFNIANKSVDYFIPPNFKYDLISRGVRWKSETDSKGNPYWTVDNDHPNYGISVKYPTEKMGRAYYSQQGPFQSVSRVEKLANGLLRVTYRNIPFNPVLGMNFQLVSNTTRPTSGALVWESKDVSLENMRISYMHGFGFLVQMSENVTFNGIRMEGDIRTGKNTASYADGIHISGAKGKIIIKNSFFNNTHDDPINIHGTFTRVEEKINNKTLRLNYIHHQQGGFAQFYPGDKVVFYSRDTLESRDNEHEYTVKKVKGPTSSSLKSMEVEFVEDLPDYLTERIGREPKYVAENITYTPEVEIKNNKFINVFTRHILVTSRKKVIIDGNDFEASTMPATFFSNDSDEWYESGPIRDLEITNNTFKIRSIGRTWWRYAPAIYFHPVTKGGGFPNWNNPIHKNILVKGNTFYLESDGALRAESVENLTFENNKIYRLHPEINLFLTANENMNVAETQTISLNKQANVITQPQIPAGPERNSGSTANVLEFASSKNIIVRNNEYDSGLKDFVLIENMPLNEYHDSDNLRVYQNRNQRNNASPALKEIFFVSTDPDVATIDNKGVIIAKKAGFTEIFAYTVWNGTIIESNRQPVTVSGNKPELLKLELDKYVYNVDDTMNSIDITKDNVSLKDLNFESLNPEIVLFNDASGNFEVLKTGIAKIKISQANKIAEIFLVANHTASQYILPDYLTVENENDNISILKDKILIQRNNGEDLWANANNLNNLVRLSLQDKNINSFSAMVTLEGLPLRQTKSWDSAYFTLYKLKEDNTVDRDNYISVGKRAHADGFGVVKEENQRGQEDSTGTIEHNNQAKMTFVIEKKGETVELYYFVNNEFNFITFYNAAFLGEKLALGVGGWGNTQANRTLTISDFKLVEGAKENLLQSESIPFKVKDLTNSEVSDITVNFAEDSRMTTLSATKMHKLSSIIDDNGNLIFQDNEILNFVRPGHHRIYVINESETGKLSTVQEIDFNATLKNIRFNPTINGIELNKVQHPLIPAELTKVLYQNGRSSEVINIENINRIEKDGQIIEFTKKNSSKVKISKIETSLGNPIMTMDNQFIYTENEENQLNIKVTASKGALRKEVYLPDHDLTYPINSEDDTISIPLYNGVNTFEIRAYAQDNTTKDIYRLHILRNHQIKKGIKEIRIKDQIVDINENNFQVDKLSDFSVLPKAKNAIVNYYIKKGNEADFASTKTLRVIVKIEHEDKFSSEYREYNLTVADSLADYSAVLAAKQKIPADLDNYTAESVQFLNEILATVKENKKAIEQNEVDRYAEAILEAINNLQLKMADLSKYNDLLKQVPQDLTKYTDASVNELKKVLEIDLTQKNILEQSEVDMVVERLKKSLNDLILKELPNPPAKYTVIFKDGNTTLTSLELNYGQKISPIPQAPTREGYYFKEWNTSSDGKGTKFVEKTIIQENLTFYAIYEKIIKSSIIFEDETKKPDGTQLIVLAVNSKQGRLEQAEFKNRELDLYEIFLIDTATKEKLEYPKNKFGTAKLVLVKKEGKEVEKVIYIPENEMDAIEEVKIITQDKATVTVNIDHLSKYALIYKENSKEKPDFPKIDTIIFEKNKIVIQEKKEKDKQPNTVSQTKSNQLYFLGIVFLAVAMAAYAKAQNKRKNKVEKRS